MTENGQDPLPGSAAGTALICGPPKGCACPEVAWSCICGAAERREPNPTYKMPLRCRHCGDTLHRLANGWGHDADNMACCMRRYWYGDGVLVTAEPEVEK